MDGAGTPPRREGQLGAFRATVCAARRAGRPLHPGTEYGLEWMEGMLARLYANPQYDEAKVGRWLGYAQGLVVAAQVGITVEVLADLTRPYVVA